MLHFYCNGAISELGLPRYLPCYTCAEELRFLELELPREADSALVLNS